MLIRWAPTGRKDILALLRYYTEQDEKDIGQMVYRRIVESTARLAEFPKLGREGRFKNTRELILADLPYIVVYRIKDHVEIVGVKHTRKKFP